MNSSGTRPNFVGGDVSADEGYDEVSRADACTILKGNTTDDQGRYVRGIESGT